MVTAGGTAGSPPCFRSREEPGSRPGLFVSPGGFGETWLSRWAALLAPQRRATFRQTLLGAGCLQTADDGEPELGGPRAVDDPVVECERDVADLRDG